MGVRVGVCGRYTDLGIVGVKVGVDVGVRVGVVWALQWAWQEPHFWAAGGVKVGVAGV